MSVTKEHIDVRTSRSVVSVFAVKASLIKEKVNFAFSNCVESSKTLNVHNNLGPQIREVTNSNLESDNTDISEDKQIYFCNELSVVLLMCMVYIFLILGVNCIPGEY